MNMSTASALLKANQTKKSYCHGFFYLENTVNNYCSSVALRISLDSGHKDPKSGDSNGYVDQTSCQHS